jgi:RimJ/RimL family protein N-acetyltransferase
LETNLSSSPIIETERLRLRPHALADFPACLELWTDEQVVRFIGGRASTAEEVWGRILRYAGMWSLLGFGYWVVEQRGDGAFLGELGFSRFARGLGPDFDDAVETGWAFLPSAQGQGFAREALTAALIWLDGQASAARLVCMIAPLNAASIRLALSAGFSPYRSVEYKGAASNLFEREG